MAAVAVVSGCWKSVKPLRPHLGHATFRLSGGELRQDADESPGSLPAMITDFWPEPGELPASRAHLVERY